MVTLRYILSSNGQLTYHKYNIIIIASVVNPSDYTVIVELESGITLSFTVGADMLFLMINLPEDGASYSVTVMAINGAGLGEPGMFHKVTRKDNNIII